MYCSVCYMELRQGHDLFITCADCEDNFHYGCLQSEVLGAFFDAMVKHVHWYCRNCADDSQSARGELLELECSVSTDHLRPVEIPQLEDAAMALEIQDAFMETLDNFGGPLMDQDCAAKRAEMEVEEEKRNDMEVVQTEGEKEASKEPKIKPGNADD